LRNHCLCDTTAAHEDHSLLSIVENEKNPVVILSLWKQCVTRHYECSHSSRSKYIPGGCIRSGCTLHIYDIQSWVISPMGQHQQIVSHPKNVASPDSCSMHHHIDFLIHFPILILRLRADYLESSKTYFEHKTAYDGRSTTRNTKKFYNSYR